MNCFTIIDKDDNFWVSEGENKGPLVKLPPFDFKPMMTVCVRTWCKLVFDNQGVVWIYENNGYSTRFEDVENIVNSEWSSFT